MNTFMVAARVERWDSRDMDYRADDTTPATVHRASLGRKKVLTVRYGASYARARSYNGREYAAYRGHGADRVRIVFTLAPE